MTKEEYTQGMMQENHLRSLDLPRLARARYEFFAASLGKPTFRILEIGCGSGGMAPVYESLGCTYQGIDIDPRIISFAQSRGVNATCEDFLDMDEAGEKFDVITASQVLEHITVPTLFAKKLASMLSAHGVFQIDVPYHHSLPALAYCLPMKYSGHWRYGAICTPYHLYGYTVKSMSMLFSREFDVDVFPATTTDRIWGQPGGAGSIMARVNGLLDLARAGSLLVACGKLKAH